MKTILRRTAMLAMAVVTLLMAGMGMAAPAWAYTPFNPYYPTESPVSIVISIPLAGCVSGHCPITGDMFIPSTQYGGKNTDCKFIGNVYPGFPTQFNPSSVYYEYAFTQNLNKNTGTCPNYTAMGSNPSTPWTWQYVTGADDGEGEYLYTTASWDNGSNLVTAIGVYAMQAFEGGVPAPYVVVQGVLGLPGGLSSN